MIAALRRLGFDKVFDTNFTADLTIIEEGHELSKGQAMAALAHDDLMQSRLDQVC
jgi:iron only hydrogenase large subunit-like protein